MDRIWLQSYPAGMPAEIDPDRFASIPEMLDWTVAQFGDKPAFHNLGRSLRYRELDRLSRDFAAFLQQLPGLAKGDRIAIMSPNLLQYPVAIFGILRAGMTVVNINPLYTARELEYLLKDSGARAIVIVENFAATLASVLPNTSVEHVITTALGDLLRNPKRWLVNFVVRRVRKLVPDWRIAGAIDLRSVLRHGATCPLKPVGATNDDTAFLQYTGGTTGLAKGAILTHRNILANLEQTGAWLSGNFSEGAEIVIAPLPLYHIFCLTSTLLFMRWGSLVVLITNPRDLPAFVKEMRKWKWTVMTGVNTLFNGLMNTPGFDRVDFKPVKLVVGGGASVQKAVAERWMQVTHTFITEAYGLTETSPGACANLPGVPWSGKIGLPLPSTDISIRDEHFNPLPPWTGADDVELHTGEICVRGPQVMQGYWNQPAETADVMRDGWLRTGDVGHMDADGYVTITDRQKDMIVVSGFKVYPNEIEGVVAALPGVQECGVVGVPDAKTGEAVKVVIVRGDPALTEDMVIASCRAQLTAYKVPHIVEFRDSLPKSAIGKVLRRELRSATP
jgi:long-chain acyl-CoA synthetase